MKIVKSFFIFLFFICFTALAFAEEPTTPSKASDSSDSATSVDSTASADSADTSNSSEPEESSAPSALESTENASTSNVKKIKAIDVKGNIGVNKDLIFAQIKSKIDDPFLRDLVNEDMRKIYGLGFFSDISIEVEELDGGVKVVFVVEEKLSIKAITFEGNKVYKQEKLLKEIDIKSGEIFNEKLFREAMKKVLALYKKKGYHKFQYDLDIKSYMSTRQVDVIVKINENKQVFVKKVFFDGNKAVKNDLLKKKMKTKERWLFNSGFFDEELLQEDLERVEACYRTFGYMNVKAAKPIVEYGTANAYVNITIPIEEGTCFKTGIVELKGNLLFTTDNIVKTLKMKEGTIFSQEKMLEDQKNIQNFYADKGYIFALVRPSIYVNQKTNIVDVTYTIIENELAYVERILIEGNLCTKDKVIRRNLLVHPLEPFDGSKLKRSREKLYNLNYFEVVDFETAPGSKENYRDLIVKVQEKKTGEFSFGGGYSSLDGMIGFVEIAQNNFDAFNFPTFLGGGQTIKLRTEFGARKKSYELGFTEPWLFDTPLLFGFDIFDRKWERSDYDEERIGYDLRLGYPLGTENYFTTMFKQEKVKIFINDTTIVDPEFIDEQGTTRLKTMTYTLTRDTRDNVNMTRNGYVWTASIDETGGFLGGDIDLMRYFASADHYFPLCLDNWVFESKGRMGSIDAYGGTHRVPMYERFYAGGGSSIRGYKERSVGPKGSTYDDIGGSSLLIFNEEVTFPILDPLRGALFADAGNVWTGGSDWKLGDLKKSWGFGVRIKTPFGPVKIDYGFALNAEDYEDKSRLHFSMGGFF